jgi:hypothetical protein
MKYKLILPGLRIFWVKSIITRFTGHFSNVSLTNKTVSSNHIESRYNDVDTWASVITKEQASGLLFLIIWLRR